MRFGNILTYLIIQDLVLLKLVVMVKLRDREEIRKAKLNFHIVILKKKSL